MRDKRRLNWWRILGLAFGLATASVAAYAEDTDSLEKTNRPAIAVSGGSDGFVLQSAEGDKKLQMGLLLQADGQFDLSDSNRQVVNTFSIGRLRPYVRGRLSRNIEIYFAPEFAGGNVVVQDAYIDTIL
jgi:hypothetical protein